ncbi:Crp/Fnr family transcriptional regulator [Candidatus Saccharibacteria bacterium]|nr:Crp/Fnr family transcriptional regulator [Candidatus Saccharibacteria bacterium]
MADNEEAYGKRIDKLFLNSRSKVYPKNQLIHYQGDPLTQIYLVKSGFIKSYTILDSGDTRTILILATGDIFPLSFSATMDWHNYKIRYFYQTLSDVELLALPAETLLEHLQDDNESLNTYMSYLAASNEAIMNQLEVMKNKKAIDKVCMLLPYLITKSGKKISNDVYELQLKLSHQEIADLSGVTRETTTTLVKQLEKKGVVDQKHANWRVNTAALDKMIEGKR